MVNTIIFSLIIGFIVGAAAGVLMTRVTTEKKERDFLQRMEILGFRNNDILDELKQVITFNNKLANKNMELDERITTFMEEWNG